MPDYRATNNRRNSAGGLHRIATLQTLANGTKPSERHHLANRFARLENERARLERELITWEDRGRAPATKLADLNARVAALRSALFEGPGTQGGLCHRRPRRLRPDAEVPASTTPHNRAATLEY